MVKLTKYSEMIKLPWKNGLGLSSEIAIHPATAKFPADDFHWRLSCAEVSSANTFSEFSGFDRILTVWKGNGLFINGIKASPLVPFYFSGNGIASCKLINSEVIDLGLIYRSDLYTAKMDVVQSDANKKTSHKFNLGDFCFIFCIEGLLNVHGLFLQTGDTLQLSGLIESEIFAASKSTYILVSIEEKGS